MSSGGGRPSETGRGLDLAGAEAALRRAAWVARRRAAAVSKEPAPLVAGPLGREAPAVSVHRGLTIAEAVLDADGLRDLASQLPDIAKALMGHDLKFNLQVEFVGDTVPNPETVLKIFASFSQVFRKPGLD